MFQKCSVFSLFHNSHATTTLHVSLYCWFRVVSRGKLKRVHRLELCSHGLSLVLRLTRDLRPIHTCHTLLHRRIFDAREQQWRQAYVVCAINTHCNDQFPRKTLRKTPRTKFPPLVKRILSNTDQTITAGSGDFVEGVHGLPRPRAKGQTASYHW